MLSFFECLFVLQFSLLWSFFQAHLVYLGVTKVETLVTTDQWYFLLSFAG